MRDQVKELDCGCKVGRTGGGQWFYDYLCEIHVAEVTDDEGHYSWEKAVKLTDKLNKQMKEQMKELRKQKRVDKTKSGVNAMSTELHTNG